MADPVSMHNTLIKKLKCARMDAGYSPLHVASEDGLAEDVVKLLESSEGKGTDDFQDGGKTALMLAAREGHPHVARALLDHGADINKPGEKCGQTAIHFAAGCGQNEVVVLLVMKGAEVDIYSKERTTPLALAVEGGHMRVINTLVRNGATVCSGNIGRLRCGVEEEFRAAFNILLDGNHQKSDCPGEFLQRALLKAAKYGNLPVVKALSTKGVDLDGTADYYPILGVCSDPATALHAAAFEGQHDVVMYLLENRVRIDPVDGVLNTPLLWSVEGNHPRVAATLLEAGADIEMENAGGYSSLLVASKNCSVDMALRLLRYGADVTSMTGAGGWSVLHRACSNRGNTEAMVDLLLRWGADETAVDSYGRTPMNFLTEDTFYGHSAETKERVCKLLVNAPADRTWRRRGWLVMLRERERRKTEREGCKVARMEKEGDIVVGGVASWLLSVTHEGVLRTVVAFL
ncbi:unnamed protein product [Ectocarpus sp. 8 AP-2014]